MNAGAYGKEIKDVVTYVKYIDKNTNEIKTLKKEEINFSYRNSCFCKLDGIIIEVGMHFEKRKMCEYKEKRISSQPLDYPSAGSIFKRGEDFITAKLIEEAGLKGFQIGGAKVSEKHAGFIINVGGATAKDILDLIEYIKKVVYEKFEKKLETEVRIIK